MYNDLFLYHTKHDRWIQVVAPNSPPPRSGHQAVAVAREGGQLWIFGGEFSSVTQSHFYHFKDLWVFHLGENKWEKVSWVFNKIYFVFTAAFRLPSSSYINYARPDGWCWSRSKITIIQNYHMYFPSFTDDIYIKHRCKDVMYLCEPLSRYQLCGQAIDSVFIWYTTCQRNQWKP